MTTCSFSRAIDRHFDGALGVRDERALREHLVSCAGCRTRYERWMLLSKLDPRALSAERRIAAGLGIAPQRRPWLVPAFALAACAVIGLFVIGTRDDGFAARGHRTSQIVIYRVTRGAAPALVRERIRATDELAFAFENPGGRERLLVFGVDEHRHVVWYHPSWVNPTLDPVAVPITRAGELAEAIHHDLDGRTLIIYGVFADRAIGVREVERVVADHGELGSLGTVHATPLVVEQP